MTGATPTPEPPACRVCGDGTVDVLHITEVPSLCNYFWESSQAARLAPKGSVRLTYCARCDLLSNVAFDDTLVSYTASYENSIHFSPAFDGYSRDLAQRLVDRYDLRGKDIVEVGCGSGDFLALLCRLGGNHGVGYDPSHDPVRAPVVPDGADFEVRRSVLPEDGVEADFIAARHVLEHVPDPLSMLSAIRRSIGDRRDVVVYIEVPDATYMLEEPAIWDVIHEHCSYFTETSLRGLLRRAGFDILDAGRSLGNQYLWVEAAPVTTAAPVHRGADERGTALLVQRFERQFRDTVTDWTARLDQLDPARTAIWGAGAKGVMFLNLVDPQARLRTVVDVNPHKHGRFVPCTAQRIVGPASLDEAPPDHVVVMNPLFQAEIETMLRSRGIDAEVCTT